MEKNGMFRVSLFGGYNKDDVQDYIKTLENEIDAIKVLHQKEKGELLRQIEKSSENNQVIDQIPMMQEEMQRMRSELAEKELELGKVQKELAEKELEFGKAQMELEEREALVQKSIEEREALEAKMKESAANMQNKVPGGKSDNDGMGEDFLGMEVISQIMNDAKKNAEMIEAEAKKNAEYMLEAARVDVKECEKEAFDKMNAELEKKGIQLFAAKHKINQYVDEVKQLQEGLYHIYTTMNHMVQTMPVRLDDYWRGVDFKILEGGAQLENKEENADEDNTIREDAGTGESQQAEPGDH